MIATFEAEAKWRFAPGFANDKPSARLTIDPVFVTQRPFFAYLTIMTINVLTHMVIRAMGFKRRKKFDTPAQFIYHRPASKASKANLQLKAASHPIIFIHGIGDRNTITHPVHTHILSNTYQTPDTFFLSLFICGIRRGICSLSRPHFLISKGC